jgi:hypothetical protein
MSGFADTFQSSKDTHGDRENNMRSLTYPDYYDIVILPPKIVTDYSISLSQNLRPYGKWTLGKRQFIPHISLYHIPVRSVDFPAFVAEIAAVLKRSDAGRLQTTTIRSNLLMLDKPEWIRKLYMRVIKRTLPYFHWEYPRELWRLNGNHRITSRRKYYAKYGSPMVGINFEPHITLTVFQDNVESNQLPKLKSEHHSFKVDRIAICELGPSHSCQRIVEQIPF